MARFITTLLHLSFSAPVLSVAYRPDGRRIVSGSVDKTIKVWNAEAGQETPTIDTRYRVYGLALSPDGLLFVSGTSEKTPRVWNVKTLQQELILEGHERSVPSVAYRPDGRRIATGSTDQTIKICDAKTAENLMTLKGHGSGVTASLTVRTECRSPVAAWAK